MSITERFEVELWEPRPLSSSAALRPCTDEALLSWLHRYAMPFGISASLLLFNRADVELLNPIDWWRRPHPQLLTRLAARTGVVGSALAAMTFQDWTPQPCNEQMSPRLSCGRRFQRSRFLYAKRQWFAICPQCSAGDALPYVRKTWTVGWTSVCQTHALVLLRQCSKCRQAMHFPRFNADERFAPQRCRACGCVLSNARQRPAHPIAVRLQALLFAHSASPTVPLPLLGALHWPTAMALFDRLLAFTWGARARPRLKCLFAHIRSEIELADDLRKGHYEGLLILAWLLDQWPQHVRFAMDCLQAKPYLQRPDRWRQRVISPIARAIDQILLSV